MKAQKKIVPADGFVGSGQVHWTSRDWLTYWYREEGEGSSLGLFGAEHYLHFWALVEPVQKSVLRLYPHTKDRAVSGTIRFSNARGDLVNECTVAGRPGQLVQLPISSFMEECETDGGFRHAHLQVVTSSHCGGELEIASHTRSCTVPPLHRLDQRDPRAIPIMLSSMYHHVIAVVNPSDMQCSVKCRLYVDTRTPEEVCLIPPRGVVLLSPEVLFSSVLSEFEQEVELPAYLRLITRSPKTLGFQVLEERVFEGGEKVYGVVA